MNQVSVGLEHCLLIDQKGHLWALGANSTGNLACGDTKKKMIPSKVQPFQNKRVIDVACGDRFSVIIAEVYDLHQDQEQKYFEQRDLRRLQAFFSNELYENIDSSYQIKEKIVSKKMHVKTTRPNICASNSQVDMSRTLVDKIQNLISSRHSRGSLTFEQRGKSMQKHSSGEYTQGNAVTESSRVLMPSASQMTLPLEKVPYSQNDPY